MQHMDVEVVLCLFEGGANRRGSQGIRLIYFWRQNLPTSEDIARPKITARRPVAMDTTNGHWLLLLLNPWCTRSDNDVTIAVTTTVGGATRQQDINRLD